MEQTDDARLALVRRLARDMVAGQLSPLEGAQLIGAQASEELAHLSVFRDLAGEWESGGKENAERGILEQASLLLADTA